MIKIVMTLFLLVPSFICNADEVYSANTTVQGMVNVNGFMSGLPGQVNVDVNTGTDSQHAVEYTFEVHAQPIKKGRAYLKVADQIHYALAGLSASTSMLTGEQLPWRKTLAGNGIAMATLHVAYNQSVNKVTHRKNYKRMKNTIIVLKLYQGDELIKKVQYKPSIDNPILELSHNFDGIQSDSRITNDDSEELGSVSIGTVSIEDNDNEANVSERESVSDINDFSSDYTFEVVSRPIRKGKSYLKEVERLRYRLNYRGGVNMDTITQAKLPWRHTINREEVSEAFISTDYINSLDPFFNKKHAKLAKNTILVLNIYNGNELVSSKAYKPTKDENDAELEVEFKD